MSKKTRKPVPAAAVRPRKELVWLTVGALAAFLLLCLTNSNNIKVVAALTALATIAALLAGGDRLRGRLTWVAGAVALWVLMDGISTLYAVSGKFALYEFLKVLISFGVFVLILALSKENGQETGRRAAMLLEGCTAFAGLFSIDLISTRILSGAVQAFLEMFTTAYSQLTGVEAGVRMTSFFDNPNIFAGCVGIGVLISLGMAVSAQREGERRFHLVCLALNALSFVLAFSMGATGMIALAFVIYLILERSSRRASLLILMLETLILTVAAVFPVYMTAFDAWDGIQPVPLICAAAEAALLIVADRFIGQKLSQRLAAHGRAVFGLIAAVLALAALYVALAMNVTGGVTLEAGEGLRRSAYPDPGTYTLQVESTGGLSVTIESQNRQDTMMHTSTVLYRGDAQGAQFTVPEDSLVLYFNFSSSEGTEFDSATYQGDAGSGSIKLGYKLLPGFMANRLQGLFANQNAIQRVVFFEDGMKLFQRSPIVGLGMGAFENGIASVQSFHYETKFAHNHYIETLVETGVVGLILFVGVLVTALIAVIRSRRRPEEQSHPLTSALGGALIFMACHAAVELVFSAYAYLPLAFGVFGLIALCCGQTMPLSFVKERVRQGVGIALAVLIAAYTVLLGCNLYAKSMVDRRQSFEALAQAAALDRFEWADYALSYVVGSMQQGSLTEEIRYNASKYAQQLQQVDSNTIPIYLAHYYFMQGDVTQAFAMLDKFTDYVAADPDTWQQSFDLIIQYFQDNAEFKTAAADLYEKMETWNEEHMGTLTLPDSTMEQLEQLGVL